MKPTTIKPTWYRCFSIFGYRIYITRHRLRRRALENHTRKRTASKVARLKQADYHCEFCGRHINLNCTLYHLLPAGMPDRNHIDNIRVICPECHKHVQHVGAYRPMIAFDDAPGATSEIKQ